MPVAVVEQRVVGFADERGIVQVGFSAFLPGDYVVGFAPRGGALQSGKEQPRSRAYRSLR
ncbi:hypothetical protein NHF46_10635 [Arthrobacter alpinus]|nr:hypothetical protein [Arthrobacter alpinus]